MRRRDMDHNDGRRKGRIRPTILRFRMKNSNPSKRERSECEVNSRSQKVLMLSNVKWFGKGKGPHSQANSGCLAPAGLQEGGYRTTFPDLPERLGKCGPTQKTRKDWASRYLTAVGFLLLLCLDHSSFLAIVFGTIGSIFYVNEAVGLSSNGLKKMKTIPIANQKGKGTKIACPIWRRGTWAILLTPKQGGHHRKNSHVQGFFTRCFKSGCLIWERSVLPRRSAWRCEGGESGNEE